MSGSLPVGRRLDVFVDGSPVQQGSLNGYLRAGRVILTHSNARELKAWRTTVTSAIEAAFKYAKQGPHPYTAAHVLLEFRMPRPKSHTKLQRSQPEHRVTPDLDKLVRAILDSIPESVLDDDARVTRLVARKLYETVDHPVGVHIVMIEV